MGRFPWDFHRNDIPMDKPAHTYHVQDKLVELLNDKSLQREFSKQT